MKTSDISLNRSHRDGNNKMHYLLISKGVTYTGSVGEKKTIRLTDGEKPIYRLAKLGYRARCL